MVEFAITYAPLYFQGAIVGLVLTCTSMAGALVLGGGTDPDGTWDA